jgi:hypothetical protein
LKKLVAIFSGFLVLISGGLQPAVANEKMKDASAAPDPSSYQIYDLYWDDVSIFDGTRYSDGWMKAKVAVPKVVTCDNYDPSGWAQNCTAYVRWSVETFLSATAARQLGIDLLVNVLDSTGDRLENLTVYPAIMKSESAGSRWSDSTINFRSEKSQTMTLEVRESYFSDSKPVSLQFQVVTQSKEAAEKARLEAEARAKRDTAAKQEAESGPVRPAAALAADQRTLGAFSGDATQLNTEQRAQVKAAVEANPNAEKFICTGIRFESAPTSENIIVRKRAKEACDYAKSLNPSLSTWFQNKPTKASSYAGKVLLTIKMPPADTVGVAKTSWPWLSRATDARGDSMVTSVDLDILESRVRMETDRRMSLYVDFSSQQNLTSLANSNSELRFGFDVDNDKQEDYYLSSTQFLREGVVDGALKPSNSRAPVSTCAVSMQVLTNTIYASFNADCFPDADSMNFNVETRNLGTRADIAPDSGWYSAGLRLKDVFVCSKEQKGKHFTEGGVRSFCMLTSGTVASGKWAVVPEARVTDTNYLMMYDCSNSQKGNIVTVERSTGSTKYVCGQLDGKWKYMTEGQAKAAADKAAAIAKAAADKAAAANRAKKVAAARYSTQKAYYACNLDDSNKNIWVEVADSGRTLILNSVGRYSFSKLGVQYEDYQCVANYLKMPRSLQSKVGNTRALDGTLDGRWGSLSSFWNYHPDSGLNITFTLVN